MDLNPSESLFSNLCVLYCGVFSDSVDLELWTDSSKTTGIAKLEYSAFVACPVIIKFLYNVFSYRFFSCYMMVFTS